MMIKCDTLGCDNDFEGMEGKEDTCPDCLKKLIEGKKTNKELYEELHNMLSEMDSEESNLYVLEKAQEFMCSDYDKCEGYKHALSLVLDDDFNIAEKCTNGDSYADEFNGHMVKLLSILKGETE